MFRCAHVLTCFDCLTRQEGYFVADKSFDTLFQQVIATFGDVLSRVLHGEDDEDPAKLAVLIDVIAACLETRPERALHEDIALSLLPDVFVLAFLLPKALPAAVFPVAQKTWASWLERVPVGLQERLGAAIAARLQDAIFNTSILVRCDSIILCDATHDAHAAIRQALWISCALRQMVALTDLWTGWTGWFPRKGLSMTCCATFGSIQRLLVLQFSTPSSHHRRPSTPQKARTANLTCAGSAHMREASWHYCTLMLITGN